MKYLLDKTYIIESIPQNQNSLPNAPTFSQSVP